MAFSQVETRTWVLTATLITTATVAAVAVRFGLSPQTPAFCALAAAGVPLAFFDARTSRLPNVVTLPAYPVSLALLGAAAPFLAGGAGRFAHALTGMAVAVAFFGVLLQVSPAGIGMGDVLTELRRRSGRAADVTERGCFASLRVMRGAEGSHSSGPGCVPYDRQVDERGGAPMEESGPRDVARLAVPTNGAVVATPGDRVLPVRLVSADGVEVAAVTEFLLDQRACGGSASSVRSYALALLRWFRFLWAAGVAWDRAGRAEARDFMLWLEVVAKPGRGRSLACPHRAP